MNALAELIQRPQFTVRWDEKERLLVGALNDLTERHRQACAPYAAILERLRVVKRASGLEEVPYIPVRLFKTENLVSVAEDQVVKTLTSSGTTSDRVARIFLDAATAKAQRDALAAIMTTFLGPKRMPMILVDNPAAFRDRAAFSARGAGLLGMATFGRDHFYALDEEMRLDEAALDRFLEEHAGQPILLFGFTFMIWQYLYDHFRRRGRKLDLRGSILIHGGGWKKLQELAVDNAAFKAALADQLGIDRVHNFYGMVEQVGSVYVECEQGAFHAPNFSDVLVRSHRDWQPVPVGVEGIIQSVSVLPASYPGHSILTEDVGAILGRDDCPCGRAGTRFQVSGRIPAAELRGCSDTHAVMVAGE